MPAGDYCAPLDPATDCGMHEWHSNLMGGVGLNSTCDACHLSPVHLNGLPDINFAPGDLPGGGTVSGTWNRSAGTCSVNCHEDEAIGLPPVGNPQSWR
jgi:hypothetical protein